MQGNVISVGRFAESIKMSLFTLMENTEFELVLQSTKHLDTFESHSRKTYEKVTISSTPCQKRSKFGVH